jgi:outer membrane lipoprotein-sorting protein
MKQILLIFTCAFCFSYSLRAQYKEATSAEQNEIINEIKKTSAEMKTMKCDFTQTKELSFMNDKVVSEGKMLYKQSDKIRWEYVKPYKYVFSMDGQNVNISYDDKQNKIPVKSSKMFSEISNIMIGGVNGSVLVNSKDFTAKFMVGTNDYKITLTPLKKEIKNLFSNVLLYINKTNSRINVIEMTEKSGDKTIINLRNIQINTPVSDEIFNK